MIFLIPLALGGVSALMLSATYFFGVRMSNPIDDPDIISAIIDGKLWYCGSCESVIPGGYYHVCGESTSRSGPTKEVMLGVVKAEG